MKRSEAESLKAYTAMVLMQLTVLAMQAAITGRNVHGEGKELGNQLREYIDSMVDSDE